MKAALVVFDRITWLDFIGFYDAVTRLKSMDLMEFSWDVCSTSAPVVDDRGLRMHPDKVGRPLHGYDILFVPGGFGTRTLKEDAAFIGWLKTARQTPLKVSVCTGALLLGAAGYLAGRRATTNPAAYKELEPYCGSVVKQRVLDEGDIVTAGGVSASIDLGLHMVKRLAGEQARNRIAAAMDYPYGSMAE